jgi:hypothetical protein
LTYEKIIRLGYLLLGKNHNENKQRFHNDKERGFASFSVLRTSYLDVPSALSFKIIALNLFDNSAKV